MASAAKSSRVLITRPANATAYTAADGIGNAPDGDCRIRFGGICAPLIPFLIMSATLEYHVAALPVGMTCTLEIYGSQPGALADNAAWGIIAGDRGKHVGSINFAAPVVRAGGILKVELNLLNLLVLPGQSKDLWGILVASGGFTPAGNSEVLAVTLAGQTLDG